LISRDTAMSPFNVCKLVGIDAVYPTDASARSAPHEARTATASTRPLATDRIASA
jgi:hypothetical protein